MLICYKPLAAFRKQTLDTMEDIMEGPKKLLGMMFLLPRVEDKHRLGGGYSQKDCVRPAESTYAVFLLCSSGALRQEKLELSAQVKRLHATVDHLQGALNQVHEEVTL